MHNRFLRTRNRECFSLDFCVGHTVSNCLFLVLRSSTSLDVLSDHIISALPGRGGGGEGDGGIQYINDGGACHTFQGLKMQLWYLLGCLAFQSPQRVLLRNIKHLMTGPEGNSEFCFPRISMFPETKSRETLRFEGNKIHCSPRDQSLSDLLYSKANGSSGWKTNNRVIDK